ncbi:MAG: ABC transporter substrate-binding protein [Candidatus Rokuibacteriota bacterium]
MRHRALGFAASVLVVAVAALASGIQAQSPSGEYKIGVLEPLTGPLAGEGKRHLEGFEIVRDMINERGGVMGQKLVFAVGDAPDPTAAASEANRLITREGVKIITGTFSSTLCGAASEAAARHNVIYWETSCVDPRFSKRGLKTAFRTEIDATGFGWYNVEFIAKHLAPRFNLRTNQLKIAFLSEDSSYGQGVTESARQRAKQEFGMQELGPEYYNFRTINDFTPVIVKLKQLNPDIVHHVAYNNDAILFWRQAREQNFAFKALVHAGATGYGSPDFGKAHGPDANGPFALLEPGPGFRLESLRADGQKIEREFREAVQKRTGSYPQGGHQLAGGGLWLLKLVLDRARSDDPDRFRSAVMSLDLPVGSMINGWGVKFSELGQNANERVQHYMLQWQNGRLVTVWPEEFTTMRAKWIPLPAWGQRK